MKNFWHAARGVLIALVSLGLVLGGLSLSLAEGQLNSTRTPTIPATISATQSPSVTVTAVQTFTPKLLSPTPTVNTPTITLPSPTGSCQAPANWVAYTIKTGDTLSTLATRFNTTVTLLQQGNCLSDGSLTAGETLYMPPEPTHTGIPCGAPAGWVITIIQPGDNLYRLSLAYGVTVAQLQSANCMGTSVEIIAGQKFYVPPGPTRTPSETLPTLVIPTLETPVIFTDTPTSSTPTDTPPGYFPTSTATNTPSP